MTGRPEWGPGWEDLRSLWLIDRGATFLNHGSFGATPEPVLREQDRLRREIERQPLDFLDRHFLEHYEAALASVADFLGADVDGCAFVPNATTGVATVVASTRLAPGDEVVTTDHAYNAVATTLHRIGALTGARIVTVAVPLPIVHPADVVAAVTAALSERTRLLVIDAVTSPTGVVLPVADIVAAARELGVPVLVDGAHAPGMLDVDIAALGADYWTGNLHKWVCSPKGAALLYVAPRHRATLRPLVTSHGYQRGFRAELSWSGTCDVTAWFASPAAIDLLSSVGWDRIRDYGGALVRYGGRLACEALGVEPLVPEAMTAMMSLVPLPPGVATTYDAAVELNSRLWEDHRVEVLISSWNGQGLLRLSGHVHNRADDYERLAEILPAALR